MPQRIATILPPARLQPYRNFWTAAAGGAVVPSDAAVGALYVWQVGMCSAWYEVLAYVEMVVRHALDTELQKWNAAQGNGPEWLSSPAAPLRSILGGRTLSDVQGSAARAQRGRSTADPHFGPHPRQGVPVSHDDLVAQLTFGNLVNLLPNDPPTAASRQRFASGYTKHEQLWINATSQAFPNVGSIWQNRWWASFPTSNPVPSAVAPGYALSAALERLRRVRNRVGHHEQMFRVRHSHRHKDAILLVRSVSVAGAAVVRGLSRVPMLEAMQPRP